MITLSTAMGRARIGHIACLRGWVPDDDPPGWDAEAPRSWRIWVTTTHRPSMAHKVPEAMSEAALATLLDLVRSLGYMHTYPRSDLTLHNGCMELERRGLLRR